MIGGLQEGVIVASELAASIRRLISFGAKRPAEEEGVPCEEP